jgi:hypothetical protein
MTGTTKITYTPEPHDPDATLVGCIQFQAYQPVEIDNNRADLIEKLSRNRWFVVGEEIEARRERWDKVRAARADLDARRTALDREEFELRKLEGKV